MLPNVPISAYSSTWLTETLMMIWLKRTYGKYVVLLKHNTYSMLHYFTIH